MKTAQAVIKYFAIALGICIIVGLLGGGIWLVGLLGGAWEADPNTPTVANSDYSKEAKSLNIDLKAAQLTILEGEEVKTEYTGSHITAEQDGDTINIREEEHSSFLNFSPAEVVKLYLPKDTIFETVDVKNNAGTVDIDSLSTKVLRLALDAGRTTIGSLSASSSAEIHHGAGQVEIRGGELNNLVLEAGLGEFNLTSTLKGSARLEAGIGSLNLKLLGEKDSYSITAEKGLGSINIDGTSYKDSNTAIGTGENFVKIKGGIGAINVSF